jgi:hypothetical protein
MIEHGTLDLTTFTLASGGHSGPDNGACLLEWASYVAREPWSDHPECVCPVLGSFGRNLNDVLPDAKRQLLKQFVPASVQAYAEATDEQRAKWIIGTAGDGHAETRSYMALDWLIRTYLPAWLALTERIPAHVAQAIRELPPIVDMASARAAGVLVRDACGKAAAAHAAARADARAAAGAAAHAAAWAAAHAATRAAAHAAAHAAAWDDAWAATRAAARADARAAAGAAAHAAAWDAAGAAKQMLAPTVSDLQDSAIDLYSRMIRIGREPRSA